MTDKTAFGDRMKVYEAAEAARKTLPLLPVMVRIDGKNFSKWTKGMLRPYDPWLSETMQKTTEWLVRETNAVIGYTQSDEISLVLYSSSTKSQIFFDGKIQKLVSVIASMTTAQFNTLAAGVIMLGKPPATFDCRVWTVPNKMEAANTLLWRERDATTNSIEMAARERYSHKQCYEKGCSELQEMLFAKGINWNDYPAFFKRGSFFQRTKTVRRFTTEEWEKLPEKHDARVNPKLLVERTDVALVDMPSFSSVTNRVEVVFDGAKPTVANPQYPQERP